MSLWQDFEMAVGSGRSTQGSKIYKIKLKRFPSMFETKLHCQLVQVSEQGGRLSSSLFPSVFLLLHLTPDEK